MSAYTDLRAARPVRHFLAVTVYRALWWPAVAVAVPFNLFAAFVDWLSWDAFPAIGRVAQPVWGAVHGGALAVGNAILGYQPKESDQ